MSVLAQLKLSNIKTRAGISPVQMRRDKLIARIDEQIALASAMAEGHTFAPSRTRIIKDKVTGESRAVVQVKRVKAWWWQEPKGLFLQLKYGTKTVMLGKSQNAVDVPTKGELAEVLCVLRQAVEAGELDVQLEAAATKGR
jgi:hypothetical protein